MQPSDADKLAMIAEVIRSGDFKLKGDAIERVASLISWLEEKANELRRSESEK